VPPTSIQTRFFFISSPYPFSLDKNLQIACAQCAAKAINAHIICKTINSQGRESAQDKSLRGVIALKPPLQRHMGAPKPVIN
jgi:hypothetical protein